MTQWLKSLYKEIGDTYLLRLHNDRIISNDDIEHYLSVPKIEDIFHRGGPSATLPFSSCPQRCLRNVGKTDSLFTEFLFVDFVFGFEVVNQRLLAAIDPVGKEGEEKLEMQILHIRGLAFGKCIENQPEPTPISIP